ncbi:hypothetical protein [Pseudogemmobacter blasticus]|uniref:hypothetical protein n=1 Tax=Fuscovulum blasticum TaxID=1075 RepID=UPI0011B1ED7E|nr:hypothetical protein [Fuscovulum blasticum]
MPKEEIIGNGITERKRITYDMTGKTPGDQRAAMQTLRAMGDAIKEMGIWPASSLVARAVCSEIIGGKSEDSSEIDSPEQFAQEITILLDIVDKAVQEGDAALAAKFAFKAGDLWRTALMKWQWEPSALSGQKYQRASEVGAAARRGSVADHTPRVLSEMNRLITESGLTATAAARTAAKNGIGTSLGANRAIWQRHKKKHVTNP